MTNWRPLSNKRLLAHLIRAALWYYICIRRPPLINNLCLINARVKIISPKKFFSALRVSVWSKNNGRPAPPGILPWIRHWIKLRDWPCTLSAAELFIRSPLDHLASLNKLGDSARRVRWIIRNVMGEGVSELQNKYSCKGEINWKIKRNINETSLKFPLIYMVSKCLLTDRFLNTTKMALQYALICSAWKLSFNLLQLH